MNNVPSAKLKYCPFCKSNRLHIHNEDVLCLNCTASAPLAMWNKACRIEGVIQALTSDELKEIVSEAAECASNEGEL